MTALLKSGLEQAAPCMVRHINAATLWSLPHWSKAPQKLSEQLFALADNNVLAIQHPVPDLIPDCPIPIVGQARIDTIAAAEQIATLHQEAGYQATTLHVGNGLEHDQEIDHLIASVVEASVKNDYPLFVETHRATVTQDIRRTLDLIDRIPEVRFNADLSHWYTGHEMPYGDIDAKFDALTPLFDRVRYMHGRIGTSCCAQVRLQGPADDRAFVDHFREMWRRCSTGFLNTAQNDEILPFAPELLPYSISTPTGEMHFYYSRKFQSPDGEIEESDRWKQAAYLWDIAETCAKSAGLSLGRDG